MNVQKKEKIKMTFDYKKEYKEFYLPPKKPVITDIPEMNYIAVRGKGNPNEPEGEYKAAMSLLYGISFTIKMSYKSGHEIEGYFPYVVPPLEGLWYQKDSSSGIDYSRKDDFRWISMIRLPEFVTRKVFDWAVREASDRKDDFCWISMNRLPEFVTREVFDWAVREATEKKKTYFSGCRMHHEIYLSDPRRTAPEKLRTVIRLPIRRK